MVSPQTIIYNGMSIEELNPLDLILDVAFDSDNGAMSSYLNRSAVASESHDGRYKNTTKYKYDELFSPQFTIVKKDFSDFTHTEVRQVLKYLTQTDKPALLEVDYDKVSEKLTEERNWCAIGGWTSIELYKIANSRVVGIVATFEAITPYAMSILEPENKTISESNKVFIINTDDNKPVYPRITIQERGIVVPSSTPLNMYSDMVPNTVYKNGSTYYWKSDESALVSGATEPNYGWTKVTRDTVYSETDEIKGKTVYYYTSDQTYRWIDPYTFKSSANDPNLSTTSVKITNKHTDLINPMGVLDALVIKNNTGSEKIVIDGANRIISSSNTRRIFGDDFNWKWLEMYDGTNEIIVEGNCTVTLEWREVRKVGEY